MHVRRSLSVALVLALALTSCAPPPPPQTVTEAHSFITTRQACEAAGGRVTTTAESRETIDCEVMETRPVAVQGYRNENEAAADAALMMLGVIGAAMIRANHTSRHQASRPTTVKSKPSRPDEPVKKDAPTGEATKPPKKGEGP